MLLQPPSLQEWEWTGRSPALVRWLWSSGICIIILVFVIHMATVDRQAPWEDEIFVVSTALSMAHSQPAKLSVLAQYPQTGSPVKFYGPVSFCVAALEIRIFGLSLTVWRLTCLAGLLLTALVSASIIRLAGGGKWKQLITATSLVLAGSTTLQQPGRWDFVTASLFLGGLWFFLRSAEVRGSALLWRTAVAGGLIGFALGSTPRVLPLCVAMFLSVILVALFFRQLSTNLLLGSACTFVVALLVQTLLLLPWGLNSFSWYVYVERATKVDGINATPVTGLGAWSLNLQYHKVAFLLLILLTVAVSLATVGRRKRHSVDEKLALKIFVTVLALLNLLLMFLLLENALGGLPYWMPLIVIALLCWLDRESLHASNLYISVGGLIAAALLILIFQNARQTLAILLTWNRRSDTDLTAFVQQTIPGGAVVYGPVGGYFYSVELAGDTYLYPFERTTPGLYSPIHASVEEKIEEEVCSHPTYAMWPEADPPRQIWAPLPDPLRVHAQKKVSEFHEPVLSPWKDRLLRWMGPVGGKYGSPDVAIYRLTNLEPCEKT